MMWSVVRVFTLHFRSHAIRIYLFFKILTLYIISCCFKYFFKCCVYVGLLVCEFRSDLFFTSLQDFTWSFSKMMVLLSFLHRIQHSNFGGILFYSDRGNTKLFYSFSLNVTFPEGILFQKTLMREKNQELTLLFFCLFVSISY